MHIISYQSIKATLQHFLPLPQACFGRAVTALLCGVSTAVPFPMGSRRALKQQRAAMNVIACTICIEISCVCIRNLVESCFLLLCLNF